MRDHLERFKEAHQRDYATALAEIRSGRKKSHWMWYIFPQIHDLGFSSISQFYAIQNLREAREYLNDSILGNEALLLHDTVRKSGSGKRNIFKSTG